MKRVVVLGTGTGVGKTHVSVQLLLGWRGRGHPAWGLKPIESGVSEGEESDAGRLRAAGSLWSTLRSSPGGPGQAGAAATLHHQALGEPLSPHLAARRAGLEISISEVVRWTTQRESELVALHDNAPHAMSLVETAGGAWTPLSPSASCVDLALALVPTSVLLVAPDALGVLHDVSATLRSLEAVGCSVDLVVLSASRPRDGSTSTNAGELEGVVFPALGEAAPRVRKVFALPQGSAEGSAAVNDLLDAWQALG